MMGKAFTKPSNAASCFQTGRISGGIYMLQLVLSGVGAHRRTVSMQSVGILTTSSPVIRNLAHMAPARNAFASFQRAMMDSSFQEPPIFTATLMRSCPTWAPSCRNETTSPDEQDPLLQSMAEQTRISAAGTPGNISCRGINISPRGCDVSHACIKSRFSCQI